jgi:hypothetical protein
MLKLSLPWMLSTGGREASFAWIIRE